MTVSDEWAGCYSANWVGVIQEDSFAHPAKYSRALIQRIYAHLAECGAIWPGAIILDPFGGVGLGAIDAMFAGCQWVGVELERRFHQLGLENICLWNERYKGWPGWGRATLLNGDSRYLRRVVSECCSVIVSSPPFVGSGAEGDGRKALMTNAWNANPENADKPGFRPNLTGDYQRASHADTYGQTTGQLGNLKEGDFAAVISSPPYAESNVTGERNFTGGGGNETPASSLRKGQVAAVVASPPYANNQVNDRNGIDRSKMADGRPGGLNSQAGAGGYGQTEGQLGAMKDAGFDAACIVSSPPFEDATGQAKGGGAILDKNKDKYNSRKVGIGRWNQNNAVYGESDGQLGNEQGTTFWEAARQIVTECYHLLRPGGFAVWVTKGFVRKKAYVDFPGQWRQLCESVGFTTIHEHRAMLVTDAGEQGMLFDEPEQLVKARKSFFRRLAEKKGSPAIDFEIVHCMTK